MSQWAPVVTPNNRAQLVSVAELQEARKLLRQGWSLKQVAEQLHLFSADLDLALWRNIGRGWEPMF